MTSFERMERVPPLKMILYCSMAGIGVLFFILTYMFLVSKLSHPEQGPLPLPKFFSVSTVLVLFSGFYIQRVPVLYRQDDLTSMKPTLFKALGFAAAFTVTQAIGWQELLRATAPLTENAAGMLLFILSALHLLHLAGGIAFASFLFLKTSKASADPVRTLIYIRDPYRSLQIDMLRTYWHFLGALWLVLYFVFLFAL